MECMIEEYSYNCYNQKKLLKKGCLFFIRNMQGRIYYEAKEAGASGPGAGGGPRAFFPANFIYIQRSNLVVGPGPGDSLKSWRACLCFTYVVRMTRSY